MRKIERWAGHGRDLQMIYSVKAEVISDCTGAVRKCYGIEIVALPDGEHASVNAITTDRSSACRLAGILSRYSVTPTTVHDVVYDWLCADAEL